MSTMSFYALTKPYRVRHSFLLAENLRTFHLSLDYRHFHRFNAAHFLTEFPFWLEGCKALSKVIVQLPIYRGVLRTEERNQIVFGMMDLLYEKVGVEGRYVKTTEYGMAVAEQWEWEAPAGTYMDWSKGLGKKWNPTGFREACRLMLLRLACRADEVDWE
jgi:hypothetical protein